MAFELGNMTMQGAHLNHLAPARRRGRGGGGGGGGGGSGSTDGGSWSRQPAATRLRFEEAARGKEESQAALEAQRANGKSPKRERERHFLTDFSAVFIRECSYGSPGRQGTYARHLGPLHLHQSTVLELVSRQQVPLLSALVSLGRRRTTLLG